jgi:hypothetical protein
MMDGRFAWCNVRPTNSAWIGPAVVLDGILLRRSEWRLLQGGPEVVNGQFRGRVTSTIQVTP